MHANEERCPSAVRAVVVTLGVALVALSPLTPASATASGAVPQLSIAVDNGRPSAAVGDAPTYTITIRNLGTTRVKGLRVTQSVPTGLTFKSADAAGIAKGGSVSWRMNMKATSKATLHTTMTVSKTPRDLLRLATVACASLSAKGPPIVCASDSDQLPAGASAEASKAATGSATAASSTRRNAWYVAGGIGGTALIIGALALMARRRSLRRPADT